MARILQGSRTGNRGDLRMHQMLANLPDDWWVLNELRVADGFWKGAIGLEEKRPDFVVLAPEIGLVSIEVKDWNIWKSEYLWLNQHQVRREPDGQVMDNPWHHAWVYEQDLKYIMGGVIWVTSLVAFPLLRRAEFFNRFGSPEQLRDPQADKLVSMRLTLFMDDAEVPGGLQQGLRERVRTDPRFRPATEHDVEGAIERLIPPELRVGDASGRMAEDRQRLRVLTDRQQQVALQLAPGRNCYLDLAGSGKTNVLVSRALHMARTRRGAAGEFNVLILTYSPKLARAIRLMLEDKLRGDSLPTSARITVATLEEVLRTIVEGCYGEGAISVKQQSSNIELRERVDALVRELKVVWSDIGAQFREYDAILVDEVQDLGPVLDPLRKVLHRGDELFLVGDLAQRIFEERRLDLHRVGIDEDRRLPAQYLMYRCPPSVAEVAHQFALRDPILTREIESHGYSRTVRFGGKGRSLPEAIRLSTELEWRTALPRLVESQLRDGVSLKSVLLITSPRRHAATVELLQAADIPTRLDPDGTDGILVVTQAESKGLEGEVVILDGVEDLPVASGGVGGLSVRVTPERESLSRRLVYVAITRSTNRLLWLYRDASNRIVADLLREVRAVVQRVQ